MKKVFLNFLIICCVFNAAKGQWVLQTSGTTNALRSVYFIDDNTGWTVGSNGTILKTSNGGTNWVNLSYLINVFLQGVRFVNQSTGWCVGDSGIIINTTNGGTNWYTQNSGTINELYSVFFINADTGWVVGNNNTILKTTTWVVTGCHKPEYQIQKYGQFFLLMLIQAG